MAAPHSSSLQEDIKGLRNDAQWNPVLPSSPEDEQLTPILSDRIKGTSVDQNGGFASQTNHEFSLEPTSYEGFDFSDGFSNDFMEGAEFAGFENRAFFRTGTGFTQDEPMSATSLTSKSLATASRKSTGLANMSSQLMSPALTDAASPGSIGVQDSPIIHHKVLGGGIAEDLSSDGTFGNSSHTLDMSGASKASTNTSTVSQKQTGTRPALQTPQSNRKRRGSDTPATQTLEDQPSYTRKPGTEAPSRHGLDPGSRGQIGDEEVMNLKEQENKRAVDRKNIDISRWLSRSELSAADHEHLSTFNPVTTGRRRSRSTGDQIILPPHILTQLSIPEEYSEDEGNDSDLASYHEEAPASYTNVQVRPSIAIDKADEDGPLKPQDAFPWVDPIRFPSEHGYVGQPGTANEAMMKFLNRARDIDSASRVGTWGTQRRMSDGDTTTWNANDREMQRIWGHGGLFSRLSLTREKEEEYKEDWRNFKEHAKEKAARWWPKRDSLNRPVEPARSPSKDSYTSPAASIKSKRESTHDLAETLKAKLHRHSNAKKPKSPEMNGVPERSTSPTGTFSSAHTHTHSITAFAHAAKGRLSRHGSKDDSSHLASLWRTSSGGPPIAPIAYPKLTQSPHNRSETQFKPPSLDDSVIGLVPVAEPTPITTEFRFDSDLPIPTLEGFKINARRKLPNLPPFLVDRLAIEQLRRYKKLVEFKVKHAKLVATNSCPSGHHCIAREGHVDTFPSKAQKEPLVSQLGVNLAGDPDEDDEALDDGILTENSFPPGMPATPAKRLPAQFECPLCFQVKKFMKPSDWSKHVHEDLQPFTCTFMECPEPKSFKRKADWVRHENERHRHLEWWQCTEEGCSHQCYRRDNFVQHLCREHKMPEPKAKTVKPDNKPAVRGPAKTKGKGNIPYTPETKVLWMVENCRHETTDRAIDEPCRLCGRAFSTFKKLTVDLAKHMEDLSLPVLELVNQKPVNTETVVSPIDVKAPQFNTDQSPYMTSSNVSPYEQGLNVHPGMSDLPGAFAPLPMTTSFQQPHFGDVAWNQGHAHTGTTAMFPGQIDTWSTGNIHYGAQGNHLFPEATNQYTHLPGTIPTQDIGLNYQDNSALLAEMNVSPGYTGTNFGDVSSAQAAHHSPPLGFSGDMHGNFMSGNTGHQGEPGLYSGDVYHPGTHQQPQQGLHMQQQQQQHGPQQQQQPLPSQVLQQQRQQQTQFFQPTY